MDDKFWFVYVSKGHQHSLLAGTANLTAEAAAAAKAAIYAELDHEWVWWDIQDPGNFDPAVEAKSVADLKSADPVLLLRLASEWEKLEWCIEELERSVGRARFHNDEWAFFVHWGRVLEKDPNELRWRASGLRRTREILKAAQKVFCHQAATESQAGDWPPLDAMLQSILEALDGVALRVEDLADKCTGGDSSRLYKVGLKKILEARGLVKHQNNIGYFRPDRPPTSGKLLLTGPQAKEIPAAN